MNKDSSVHYGSIQRFVLSKQSITQLGICLLHPNCAGKEVMKLKIPSDYGTNTLALIGK